MATGNTWSERRLKRQRWSLLISVVLVIVGLAVAVVLLLSAASEFLPDVPGLDFRIVQGGLIALAVAFGAYAIDRERYLRRLNDRLFEQRLETERLRALDEMKDTFLRAVSHDLRSPLTSILTAAALLRDYSDRLTGDVAADLTDRIRSQAQRLDRMLSDILDLDRLSRGIVEPRLRPVDVATVVREAVDGCETDGRELHVEGEELVLAVDRAQVERIVDNLVRNAVKYTPADGPIWVRVTSHNPEPTVTGALICVDDAGPGIPDPLKRTIFEAFRRGESDGETAGTGVGLHLVARFAELHGGRAWVEDRPEGGASFRVFLPDRRRVPER